MVYDHVGIEVEGEVEGKTLICYGSLLVPSGYRMARITLHDGQGALRETRGTIPVRIIAGDGGSEGDTLYGTGGKG